MKRSEHGKILREHLDIVRRTVDNARNHQALLRDQQLFVDWVADYDFTDYQTAVGYWLLYNDPGKSALLRCGSFQAS